MWPDGTSGSRVLIRISVPPYSLAMRSHVRRTVGTACPAPHSIDRKLRAARDDPATISSGASGRRSARSSHSKSPNIRIFGRARAPHSGHSGRRRLPASSPDRSRLSTALPGKIPIPHSLGALHALEAAVNFDNLLRGKARPLEMPVDIRGENEPALSHPARPASQNREPRVRRRSDDKAPSDARRNPRPARGPRRTSADWPARRSRARAAHRADRPARTPDRRESRADRCQPPSRRRHRSRSPRNRRSLRAAAVKSQIDHRSDRLHFFLDHTADRSSDACSRMPLSERISSVALSAS